MRKRILYFCDSKWRDLPGAIFVEQQLNNHDVLIVPYNHWQDILPLFVPHIVILNHIQGERNRMIADRVRRWGGKVVVLYNEGILEFSNKSAIFQSQADHPLVDRFLCWNEPVANLLGNKADVVGCPRFDAYTHYDWSLMSREEFCELNGLDCDVELVVMGDSWPSSRFSYQMQSFHRSNWIDLGNTKAAEWSSPEEFARSQFESREKFRSLAVYLNSQGYNVVVKTHPMADYESWVLWSEVTGVPVIHDAYAQDVIRNSDTWISKLGSLTVAEKWLSGNGKAIKLVDSYDSGSSAEQYGSDDFNFDFMTGIWWPIEGMITSDEPTPSHDDYIKRWLAPLDGPSSVAVAEILDGIEVGKMRKEPDLPALMRAITALDQQYTGIDPWGNYGKYVTQRDIAVFKQRIVT